MILSLSLRSVCLRTVKSSCSGEGPLQTSSDNVFIFILLAPRWRWSWCSTMRRYWPANLLFLFFRVISSQFGVKFGMRQKRMTIEGFAAQQYRYSSPFAMNHQICKGLRKDLIANVDGRGISELGLQIREGFSGEFKVGEQKVKEKRCWCFWLRVWRHCLYASDRKLRFYEVQTVPSSCTGKCKISLQIIFRNIIEKLKWIIIHVYK